MERENKRRKVVKKVAKFVGIGACTVLAGAGLLKLSYSTVVIPEIDYDKHEQQIVSEDNFFDHSLAGEQLNLISILIDTNRDEIFLGTKTEICSYIQKQKLFDFIPIGGSLHSHYKSIITEQIYESSTLLNNENKMKYYFDCADREDYQAKEYANADCGLAQYMTNEELDKVLINSMTTEDWQAIEDRLNEQYSSSQKLIKRKNLY